MDDWLVSAVQPVAGKTEGRAVSFRQPQDIDKEIARRVEFRCPKRVMIQTVDRHASTKIALPIIYSAQITG